MMILKICGIAVVCVILIALIKAYKPEFAIEAVLCASLLLLFYVIGSIQHSFTYLEDIYDQLSYGKSYFPIILKALGIAYVTEFTSAICQDAGEKSIAGKVELAGKIAIFFIALPVFASLLELLNSMV